MKKDFGKWSENRYQEIDMETGEVYQKTREFNKMSLKPGIGHGFYQKWKTDLFPKDVCVINGVATKPPKYYFKKLKEEEPETYEEIGYKRALQAQEKSEDNTDERLLVKEVVLKARIKNLKRNSI